MFFGIGEFYESCADVLENFYCKKIKLSDDGFKPNSIPYKIGESIVRKIYPECSEYRLIILMLTALQHPYPHQMFVLLAHTYGKAQLNDKNVREACSKHVRTLVEVNTQWIEDTGSMIMNGFPFDDPYFGDVIKSFNYTIKKNITNRVITPFLELDFLMELNETNHSEKIKYFIEKFGGTLIYAKDQAGGASFEMEKIVIGDLDSIYHNHKGWLVFNASIFLALKKIKVLDLIGVNSDEKYRCPVFYYCEHKNKTNNFKICNETPYKHPQALDGENNCAHQLALHKIDLKNYYKNTKNNNS